MEFFVRVKFYFKNFCDRHEVRLRFKSISLGMFFEHVLFIMSYKGMGRIKWNRVGNFYCAKRTVTTIMTPLSGRLNRSTDSAFSIVVPRLAN